MYTASATTNGQGNMLTLRDSSIENIHGSKPIPEHISWGACVIKNLGDLSADDIWSILTDFIINDIGANMRSRILFSISMCKTFRKIEIDGFEYILQKKRITRRVISPATK